MANEAYDIALIRQTLAQGGTKEEILNRVIYVLVPNLDDAENVDDPQAWVEARGIAQHLLSCLFDAGKIKCPTCGAETVEASKELCFGRAQCLVAEEI